MLAGIAALAWSSPASMDVEAPRPYGAVPSPAQLAWNDMEMHGFVHFTTNTFTGREWGFGDESPDMFNPTDYDPEQIVKVMADGGMKGIILTAKHHDGFCLWPTKTTKHSVASSSWKHGKGDVVRDFANACKKYGLKFGIYLSPWDRNHPAYGTPEYIKVYREQLRELLTNYGPLFEVWHDGANGGDGYYGGKREKRSIDRSTYYDWPKTWELVHRLQPGAVIFSDVGPGCRWVGNESGFANYPCWATYEPKSPDASPAAPGHCTSGNLPSGDVNGKFWIPAEADVSIRPGWFWHESENARVRTPENLMELYFCSVGRGANLNLNVPPDRRGRIHENDEVALKGFAALLKKLYSRNFAAGAVVSADSTRPGMDASRVLDRKRTTFWMAADGHKTGTVTLNLPEEAEFDVIRLAEPIQLGQRIRKFSVSVLEDGQFVPWVDGKSIGGHTLRQGKLVKTKAVRVSIDAADAEPALSEISLWKRPVVMKAPEVVRNAEGKVELKSPSGMTLRYTLDGTEPGTSSPEYKEPLNLPLGGKIAARAFRGEEMSSVTTEELPVSTADWKVIAAEQAASDPKAAIDGNPRTLWHTHAGSGEIAPPQAIDIDMGSSIPVSAVYYTPRQDGITRGIISNYEVYLSQDGKDWGSPVAAGEFSNIKANPIRQKITLEKPVSARYMRFVGKSVVDGNHVVVAELGVEAAR